MLRPTDFRCKWGQFRMFQHLLRYVGEEDWFLFVKHLRHRANARELRTRLDRGCVRFSIELQDMQTFSVIAQDVEERSMERQMLDRTPRRLCRTAFTVG